MTCPHGLQRHVLTHWCVVGEMSPQEFVESKYYALALCSVV